MGTQLEWQALVVISLDLLVFLQYIMRNNIVQPSLIARLRFEVDCLRVVLLKQMVDFWLWRDTWVLEYIS